MIDPVQVLSKAAKATVSPIPTVIPNAPIYESVESAGGKTLYIVFIIMLLSTFAFIAMGARLPVQKRLFHYLTATITFCAALSYFAMATGDGNSYIALYVTEGHKHVPDTTQEIFRQVFWARYVDWSVTTPLLLLDLAFLAGLNGADIYALIVADIVMVLTGMFGAFGHSEAQRWAYYAMGCAAYLLIVWIMAVGGRRTVANKGSSTQKFFGSIGLFTLVLWTLYPVVWGLGEGSRILSVDGEIIAYAILDVLAKPVFGFWLLITHAKSDAVSVEGFWSNGLSNDAGVRLDDDDGA